MAGIGATASATAVTSARQINERAGEVLCRVHYGSVSGENRFEGEELLKRGELPGLVATSSLELGIDIGAIDLVVQIESPKSVTAGLQRVGRAGHLVGEVATGRVVPKYRPDLVDAAALRRSIENALERRADREAERLRIDIVDGEVDLYGRVHSWPEREAVVGSVSHAPGVKKVNDNLQIDPYF